MKIRNRGRRVLLLLTYKTTSLMSVCERGGRTWRKGSAGKKSLNKIDKHRNGKGDILQGKGRKEEGEVLPSP